MKEADEAIIERPSRRLIRTWGRRIAQGKVKGVAVYVNGGWSFHIPRGNRRVISVKF